MTRYPSATANDDEPRRRESRRDDLRKLLRDGRWHDNVEVASVAGHAYNARIKELRDMGMRIVAERVEAGLWRYRWTGEYAEQQPQRVLGKQARDVLVETLLIVNDELGNAAFNIVADCLPETWRKELFQSEQ